MNIIKANLIAYYLDGVLMKDNCCIKKFKTPVDDHVVVNRSYIDDVSDSIDSIEGDLRRIVSRFLELTYKEKEDEKGLFADIGYHLSCIAGTLGGLKFEIKGLKK